MGIINSLTKWLAVQLDKLKISNPIVFYVVQGTLITITGLFVNDTINIATPDIVAKILNLVGIGDIDTLIIMVLTALVASIGPRTTALKNGSV